MNTGSSDTTTRWAVTTFVGDELHVEEVIADRWDVDPSETFVRFLLADGGVALAVSLRYFVSLAVVRAA